MKIIATLTSIPTRIDLLDKAIRRIRAQTLRVDKIVVSLSRRYLRFSQELSQGDIPRSVRSDPGIEILWEDDLGPISKIFWAMRKYPDPSLQFLSLDDDREYPVWTASQLASFSALPAYSERALGFRGRRLAMSRSYNESTLVSSCARGGADVVPREPLPVDILNGTGAVMYRRGFFADDFFAVYLDSWRKQRDLLFSDDTYISGYLASKRIGRFVVPPGGPILKEKSPPRLVRKLSSLNPLKRIDDTLWTINQDRDYNDLGIARWEKHWDYFEPSPNRRELAS